MPYAQVEGVRLHYLDSGPLEPGPGGSGPGAPALVLLHAFPLHSGMWEPQIAALSPRWRVVAPDLLGFGSSDAPDDLSRYTMLGYSAQVAGLLDALGLDRVVLGGLSMGGYVAFDVVRHHRHRLAGLVLADTRASADTPEVFGRRTDQQDQVARTGTTSLIEVLLGGLLGDATRSTRLDLVERVRRLMANPAAGYLGALEAMKHRPDSTADLAAIDVPTLFVVGDDDALSPPEVARAMHRAVPGSELAVLPGAGHLSNLEAPDTFNAAVEAFLARI